MWTRDYFKLPLTTLEIKFQEPGWEGIKSILAGEVYIKNERGIGIYIDTGETQNDLPLVMFSVFRIEPGITVASQRQRIPTQAHLTEEEKKTMDRAVQLTLALCLLGTDDPLVAPALLTKDRIRLGLSAEDRERLAEKARRRGKIGWVIGGGETSPHYRCAHLAIRWVGKGRTIPKLTSVRASIVHREVVVEVPTGCGG